MRGEAKIEIPADKRRWSPSPLPGQVVLVTTVDAEGRPNVAPKSWISMAAFGPPPVLMFGCNRDHETARNVAQTGELVVNVPGRALAATCWAVGADRRADRAGRFERHGLTPIPSLCVAPPRIEECQVHLECELEGDREWGREVVFFGRVVSCSLDARLVQGGLSDRYRALSPFFFLEASWAAPLGEVSEV